MFGTNYIFLIHLTNAYSNVHKYRFEDELVYLHEHQQYKVILFFSNGIGKCKGKSLFK